MSKDYRFNKKEYAYDDNDDSSNNRYVASKHSGEKKPIVEQKSKSGFKRIDKRNFA